MDLQPVGRKESDFHLFLSMSVRGLATEGVSKRFDLLVLVNATEYGSFRLEVYYILLYLNVNTERFKLPINL